MVTVTARTELVVANCICMVVEVEEDLWHMAVVGNCMVEMEENTR